MAEWKVTGTEPGRIVVELRFTAAERKAGIPHEVDTHSIAWPQFADDGNEADPVAWLDAYAVRYLMEAQQARDDALAKLVGTSGKVAV